MKATLRRYDALMTNRSTRAMASLTVAVAVIVGVGGCTGAEPGPPPPPQLSEQEVDAAYAEFLDQSWQRVESAFPDAERPDVDLVRFIDQSEWAEVIVACLVEQGVDAKVSNDGQGGYESQGVVGQELSMAIAAYVCDAKYPVDPSLTQPLTDAELDYVYDYFVNVLNPCLEREGIEVTEPPSRQAFKDSLLTVDSWTPYLAVLENPGQDEWTRLNRVCPQAAPGLRGS
jgi:hypothetical protein